MKSRLVRFTILLSLVIISTSLLAQDTASITGTVTDPSGAAVKGAQVVVSSPDRGIDRPTTTNDSGDFLVAGLPSGAVNVTVTAQGFKKYQAQGVILRVGQKARTDITLQVGASNTVVEVEGTGIGQVETQSSDLTGTVTGKQITQLQLNGRNFTQLITLVPGVCSGTRRPALAKARIAPNAVMSSNAINAVKGRFRSSNSSVNLYPPSKLEIGSRDSGRSRMSLGSSFKPADLANDRIPCERGELSARVLGPRMKAILRCPKE